MLRIVGLALVLMTVALSTHSNAKELSSPIEPTMQDEFDEQQGATKMAAVSQKVCIIYDPGNQTRGSWLSATPVPSTWTSSTCQKFATAAGATRWGLGCFFANSYSIVTSGKPSPNCGW